MLQGFFIAIYNFFEHRRWLAIGTFLLTLGISAFLAGKVRFQENITSMLPDSKAIRALNNVISNTQAGEQVIFLMSFKDSTYTDPDSLISAANSYNESLKKACGKWIDTVTLQTGGGETEARLLDIFQGNTPLFLDEQDFAQLDTLLSPEHIKASLESSKKILLSPASVVFKQMVASDPAGISRMVWSKLNTLRFDPGYEVYDGYLFSGNTHTLTFFLKPAHKASETGKNSVFFGHLDDFNNTWAKQHPGMHLTYFGGPAVAAGNAMQMRSDTILTLSVTVVLLLSLMYYFFRRKRAPLLLLVPVLYGAVSGMAIVYLVQGQISVIALGAGAIIMGVAINFSLHFLSHARHSKDLRTTIRELAQPLTIGSFTTIAAFLSLRLVHTPILQDLGLFAAVSLTGAALCTLIFLPHFPLGIRHETKKSSAHRLNLIDRLANWEPESKKWLAILIVLLTPFFLYFSFNVSFDSDLMHLNYLSPRMEEAQKEVSKANAFAMSSVFLVAGGKDEETALQHLEQLNPRIGELQSAGKIRGTSNPTIFIPSRREQEKRIQRWKAFWTTERQAAIRSYIEKPAAEMGYNVHGFSAFYESLNRQYTTLDTATVHLLKQFYPGGFSSDDQQVFAITAVKAPHEYRTEVFKALSGFPHVTVTDREQSASQLVGLLSNDFNTIALYSTLIVFFALLIGYGRIELTIISFLPMAISWVWILGIMSLLGLKFNIVNIIISSLIFGLGDDYSIFTTDGMIEKYRTGENKLKSVRSAVYLSALTTIIGLGVLLLAKHPALKSIAFISVLGILCVLFISQTLQPFLFNWFIQKRADKKLLPFTFFSFFKSVFAFLYFFAGSLILTLLGFILTKLWPFSRNKGKYYFHVGLSRYTWSMMHIMFNVKKKEVNRQLADFSRPAVYVANHTSFLDILQITAINPRLVLLTNRWVWHSPVFGKVVRMAEYYPVADGVTESIEPLRDLVDRGYSIVVFPEGTRSYDDKITRFHKGAFYIAEELKLDIIPLVLHGLHYTMQKGDWLLKDGTCTIHYYPRITPADTGFGTGYSERAKRVRSFMRNELDRIKETAETPRYFKEQLIRSYIYKGPVLEWYCRIKIMQEGYYEQFHKLLPRKGVFYDLGCGYGFMTYMLRWAAPDRTFTGIDYDEEKIETAQHNFLRDEGISFHANDITNVELTACDGIIISDVLHYLLPGQQEQVLQHCVDVLRPGGVLIIRDGVSEMEERHKGTVLTEIFSTRILKFNKTQNELHFLSRSFIEAFAHKHQLHVQELDLTKRTSNVIFVMTKPV